MLGVLGGGGPASSIIPVGSLTLWKLYGIGLLAAAPNAYTLKVRQLMNLAVLHLKVLPEKKAGKGVGLLGSYRDYHSQAGLLGSYLGMVSVLPVGVWGGREEKKGNEAREGKVRTLGVKFSCVHSMLTPGVHAVSVGSIRSLQGEEEQLGKPAGEIRSVLLRQPGSLPSAAGGREGGRLPPVPHGGLWSGPSRICRRYPQQRGWNLSGNSQ
jgi:hypothetical protein